jgi:hypothetical protein
MRRKQAILNNTELTEVACPLAAQCGRKCMKGTFYLPDTLMRCAEILREDDSLQALLCEEPADKDILDYVNEYYEESPDLFIYQWSKQASSYARKCVGHLISGEHTYPCGDTPACKAYTTRQAELTAALEAKLLNRQACECRVEVNNCFPNLSMEYRKILSSWIMRCDPERKGWPIREEPLADYYEVTTRTIKNVLRAARNENPSAMATIKKLRKQRWAQPL